MLVPSYQHKSQMKKSLSISAGYRLAEMPISKFRVLQKMDKQALDTQGALGE